MRVSINFTAEAFSHFEGLRKDYILKVGRNIKSHFPVTFILYTGQFEKQNEVSYLPLFL